MAVKAPKPERDPSERRMVFSTAFLRQTMVMYKEEAAFVLGVDQPTLQGLILKKKVPVYRFSNGSGKISVVRIKTKEFFAQLDAEKIRCLSCGTPFVATKA